LKPFRGDSRRTLALCKNSCRTQVQVLGCEEYFFGLTLAVVICTIYFLGNEMQVVKIIPELIKIRDAWQRQNQTIGVVPTMGYLHAGHLALVERARSENAKVIATIFVNPLQFGVNEDLSRYPRNLERDFELLEKAGVDLVFNPEPSEMYPPNFSSHVEVQGITAVLEGASRPGHFKGVTTVVAKLFNLTCPTKAYFGQKDAQQVAVIKKMVSDLNFPLEIVVCPTKREADGLAMSSRNSYLDPAERQAAPVLYRALQTATQKWDNGERNARSLRETMQKILASEPLAKPDYISAANPLTLTEYDGDIPDGQGVLLSMAVRFGTTRLIDNFLLE
jgi:pantoate--beta-alanine ligase